MAGAFFVILSVHFKLLTILEQNSEDEIFNQDFHVLRFSYLGNRRTINYDGYLSKDEI
jgi:hypothetical protein